MGSDLGRTGGTAGFGEIRCGRRAAGGGRRATATAGHTTRDPGQPGVRLRCYPDVRRELSSQPPASAPGEVSQCADLPWSGRWSGAYAHSVCRRAGWVEGVGL
ncbi:DUF6207 family protein [Streptomyces europaeiscabiei]|uniref:DUF6207 family protein n=1 Tax=Streptomyces europaeiscabiei TaxID=146819 RepID=UPI0038F66797